jgi:peroxiredoxin
MRVFRSKRLVVTSLLSLFVLAPSGAVLGTCRAATDEAKLVDAAGHAVTLTELRGERAAVLLFLRGFKGDFACYYCGTQLRSFKAAWPRLQAAGATVIAILPGAKDVRGFLEKVGTSDDAHPDPGFTLPFPVVLDPEYAACRRFGVSFDPNADAFTFPVSEPATVVVAKDGRVAFAYHGTEPPDRPEVEVILDVVVHGAPREGLKSSTRVAAPPPPPPSELPWMSYADGLALARTDGRPVLLDFHALW